ncbi:MAG: EutN/CcmL family microcompartment protein [Planctomycetota bacterium]
MQFGRVVGSVVATQKDPSLVGLKFLVLEVLTARNEATGQHVVAVDAVGAGLDETVLYASGSSARQTQQTDKRPADAVVMAIIDSWDVEGDIIFRKEG